MRLYNEQDMLENSLLPGFYSKHVGIAKIVTPTAVTAKLSAIGDTYYKGMIWCECPELGLEGSELIPCRYGLSIPFYQVKEGDKVWIQPTIGESERWIYTGFVDCARDSIDPTVVNTQAIFENEDGSYLISLGDDVKFKIDSINKTIELIGGSQCKIEMDSTNNIITLTAGTNTIKLDGSAGKIQLNGTNLEVLV